METGLEKVESETRAIEISVDYRKEIVRIKEQKEAMDTLIKDVLKEDVHYGLIPGCGKKPSLLKPGAEALVKLFKLTPEIVTTEELLDGGHIKYTSVACLFYSGEKVGQASGSCSTLESKYAKKYGKPNENIADVYNTCRKMSEKRALVAVVLITTGASDKFTQDVEEMGAVDPEAKPQAQSTSKKGDAPPFPAEAHKPSAEFLMYQERCSAKLKELTADLPEQGKVVAFNDTCKAVFGEKKYYKPLNKFTLDELVKLYEKLMSGSK